MSTDGDVVSVFERFANISNALLEVANAQGTEFMVSEKLGYLGTCPSNLGTGLRGSVMICLPRLNAKGFLYAHVSFVEPRLVGGATAGTFTSGGGHFFTEGGGRFH